MLRSVFFRYRPAMPQRFLSFPHKESMPKQINNYQKKYPEAVENVINDFFRNLEHIPISNVEQEDLAIKNARLQREYGLQVTITNIMDRNNPKAFISRSLSLQVVDPNISSIMRSRLEF